MVPRRDKPGLQSPVEDGVSSQDKDPTKKHRHDIGAVDHGALSDEETTRSLQVLLGLCIVASFALVIYSVVHMATG